MFCCSIEEEGQPELIQVLESYATSPNQKDEPKPEPKLQEPEPKLQEPQPEKPKPAPAPEPGPAPSNQPEPVKAESFEVAVQRGGVSLGLYLDWLAAGLQILALADGGAVQTHNQGARERIDAGMVVTAVNGYTSNKDMFKEMAAKDVTRLEMTIVKPAYFTMEVSKGGGKRLGCRLSYRRDTSSSCIEITDIEDGVITEYNSRAPGDKQVKVSDCISAVNGVSGVADDMSKEITGEDNLKLTIMRVIS